MVIIVRDAGDGAGSAIRIGEGADAVEVRILRAEDGKALVGVYAPEATRVQGKECGGK